MIASTSRRTLSLAILLAVGASAAQPAVSTSVSTAAGSDFAVAALASHESNGATLSGMVVNVSFADATTSTGVWSATGRYSGRALADGWSLSVPDSTHDYVWVLTNTGSRGTIVGFSI